MTPLRSLFQAQLSEFEIAAPPAASIFEKLAARNPELPDYIIDQALRLQSERHYKPSLEKEFEASLKSLSWKNTIKSQIEKLGLGFLFNRKASPAPEIAPPARLERTIELGRASAMSKPDPFSKSQLQKDNFTIDMLLIGDDLRRSINSYLEKNTSAFDLTDAEKKTLEIHPN